MNEIGWITILLCFVLTTAIVVWNQKKTKYTIETIENMLDAAMDGSFTETAFDESKLSALETKFDNEGHGIYRKG